MFASRQHFHRYFDLYWGHLLEGERRGENKEIRIRRRCLSHATPPPFLLPPQQSNDSACILLSNFLDCLINQSNENNERVCRSNFSKISSPNYFFRINLMLHVTSSCRIFHRDKHEERRTDPRSESKHRERERRQSLNY